MTDSTGLWGGAARLRQHQLPPDSFTTALAVVPLLEQLSPTLRLRVVRILDLHPGGLRSISAVGAELPLPHDAFQILSASKVEEVLATPTM